MGAHSGTVPPPQARTVPAMKLTRSGLLECKSRPKTPKLVLIVLEFASKNCFFVVLRTHTGFHETLGTKTFSFFLVLTLEFVENRKMATKFCGHFWTEDLFFGLHFRIRGKSQEFWDENQSLWKFWTEDLFFWSSPFSFDPHSRIHINKFLVPPQIHFCPQSRYPGAGPASVAYKLIFVILLYSPSCFGQETAKEPFGLRVKLPRLAYHTLWSLHAVPFYC